MRDKKSQRYPDEFKADAVDLIYSSGESVRVVARRLGVNHWTLRDWYRADQMTRKRKKKKSPKVRRGPGSQADSTVRETDAERTTRLEEENAELRRKVKQLEMDREILKKAAAFFAKESG